MRFVIDRDPDKKFRFASLQSAYAKKVLLPRGKDPADLDTLYVLAGEALLSKSRAVFFVLRELGGVWTVAGALRFLPRFLTDLGYDLVAVTRYRLWGRFDACPMAPTEVKDRFLD